jgi:hypothetical protein
LCCITHTAVPIQHGTYPCTVCCHSQNPACNMLSYHPIAPFLLRGMFHCIRCTQ